MVLNIAHRGCRSLAPENTLAAARKGLESGADLWETDVAVTIDEKLILLHDDSLARTTDVETRFPDRDSWTFTGFTLAEIRSLDAGSWFVNTDPFGLIAAGELKDNDLKAMRGEKIPTLEEALVLTNDANWRINLELKALPSPMTDFPLPGRVLELIGRLGMDTDKIVISSFNHDWLREVEYRKPGIEIQALIGYSNIAPLDWGNFQFKTYNANHILIDEEEIRMVTEKGIDVNLFTVNEKKDMQRFAAAGAAGIITDFPQIMAELSEYDK